MTAFRLRPRLWPTLTLACGLAAAAAGAAEEATTATNAPAAAPAEAAKPASPAGSLTRAKRDARYSVRLRLEADYRTEDEAEDTDLYGYWYASGRDMADGRFDVYTSGRTHYDLDDSSSPGPDDMFRSLDDASDTIEDRVLQLYGEVHDRNKQLRLRGGRQYVDIADYLQMDGGQLMLFENGRIGGRIYAGKPVSYYSSVSGDFAGGLSLVGRPWEGNQSRITISQYDDDSEDGTDRDYFLDIKQDISDSLRARGQASVLNDEFRMGRLDLYYFSPDGGTDVYLGGSRWGEFDAETRAYSPLYRQLGAQQPYTYAYARLSREVAPSIILSPGASFRMVDSGDEGYANQDYQSYDLTLTYEPSRAFSASVALEYWDVQESDSFLGLSGEVRYRYLKRWELSGGAAYVDYTYNTYSDFSYSINDGQTVISEDGTVAEESPYALTYFLRFKWNLTKMLALRLQGDIEDSDFAEEMAYRARGAVEVRF